MPTYRVTGPDGKTYQVTAPEGASQADVLARVQSHASQSRDTTGGAIDAFLRGAADVASFGTVDKIDAAVNSVLPINKLTGQSVKSVWDGSSVSDAFKANLKLNNQIDRADAEVNPVAQTIGQVTGGVVGPVPGRGLIAKGAANLGRAAPLARVVGEAGVQSGLYGAGTGNSTSILDRLINAGEQGVNGIAGALAGYGLMRGGARLVSPKKGDEIIKLANAGVTMTPGQRGGRIAGFLEQGAESIPFVGAPIKAAKARGVQQFNTAWTNEALKPIGASLPKNVKPGNDAVAWAQKAVSDAYDKALSGINAPADATFQKTMAAIQAQSKKLPPDQKAAFDAIMNLRIKPVLAGKTNLDGRTFQSVYRSLQRDIAGMRQKNDPIADLTADALNSVLDNFNDLASRHAGPSAKAFKAANEASARLARVEDAAARPQSVGGIFTPSTAMSAASKKGYGTNRQNLARGDARMQALADAAKAVLPDTLPNSGTADRAALMTLLGGAGSGTLGAYVSPGLALPAAGLAPYVPGLDRVFQKASLRGQSPTLRAFSEQVRKAARVGGMIGAPLAIEKRK